MEKAIELLKIFLEKHLIPTIISFVISIAVYLFTPADYWVLVKLGKILYVVFFWASIFIIVELFIFLFQRIKCKIENKKLTKQKELIDKETKERREKEHLELLWSAIDDLDPSVRKCVHELVTNNNSHLVLKDISYKIKLSYKLFDTTEVRSANGHTCIHYKLKNDIFELLRYSYEKYKKISHFE